MGVDKNIRIIIRIIIIRFVQRRKAVASEAQKEKKENGARCKCMTGVNCALIGNAFGDI